MGGAWWQNMLYSVRVCVLGREAVEGCRYAGLIQQAHPSVLGLHRIGATNTSSVRVATQPQTALHQVAQAVPALGSSDVHDCLLAGGFVPQRLMWEHATTDKGSATKAYNT